MSEDVGWDRGALDRVAKPLAKLIDVALERERMAQQAAEAEATRRADVAKTAVLHAISHDLRSPLTGVTAAAGALRGDRLSAADRAELVSVIETEAERLARLIDDLLDLSRIQAGAVQPRTDWTDLHETVVSAIAQAQAIEGDHAIDYELPPDLPLVKADPAQLERVFANLIQNAIKFSPPDTPVRVTGGVGSGSVTVRVIDRGRGIPPSQRANIFEPFFKGRNSSGSGLGLAIVRGLRRGKRRPYPDADRDRRGNLLRGLVPACRAAGGRGMTEDGRHVLVVDDEPQIVRGLKVILRGAGYEVETAGTKREALDAVSVRPPDAVVLDLVLPDGSGVDVATEITEVEPASDPGAVRGRRRT